MNDPTQPAVAEVSVIVTPDPAEEQRKQAQEAADVKKWFETIEAARKFDEPAREQYAKDRRYARGDSGFEVDANIVGTNIDILESFLYARDPDVDVRPSVSAEPPSLEAMRDAASDHVDTMPDVQAVRDQSMQALQMDGADPATAQRAADQAADAMKEHLINKQFQELRKRYQRRQRDNKAFAETLEIIVSRLWKDARLKARGVRWVRSALTIGLGVLKASWQERTAPSPETVTAINDLQADIKRAASLREELDESSCADQDAKIAEYQRQLVSLRAQVERVVARGMVIDLVPAEDFQVAPGYAIADHLDAPWNAHRIPMRLCDAKAEFELTPEQAKQATRYAAKKPVMVQRESALIDTVKAADADAYESSTSATNYAGDTTGDFVMLTEIWDRDTNNVLTGIEGIKRWVKPAWQPSATTRFYPFFVLCTSEVDGQRHPQSLVSRSAKIVDQINRTISQEADHRRRIKPKIAFNAGMVSPESAKKLMDGVVGEWVPVNLTQPKTPLINVVWAVAYPPLDPALYDTVRYDRQLERIWGIQEALSGSINTQKTLGEAQIQQSGFNARTSGRRDGMEMGLADLAQYSAELARAHVTLEDAQSMAGPDAMWPDYSGPDDLSSMVNVSIRAGSSGKPDTSSERQAWANQLPLLQNGIMQIGQLRGSSPLDIADALERLLKITAERSGDRIDVDSLVPQAGNAPAMPMPGQPPGAMPPGAPGEPPTNPAPPALPPPVAQPQPA